MEIVNISMEVLYQVCIYLNTNLVKDIVGSQNFFLEKLVFVHIWLDLKLHRFQFNQSLTSSKDTTLYYLKKNLFTSGVYVRF